MMRLEGSRPGDERGFVHKRLLGGIKGFIGGGFNPLSGLTGFLAPPRRQQPRTTRRLPQDQIMTVPRFAGRQPARRVLPRTITARPSPRGESEKELGRRIKVGGGGIGGVIDDVIDIFKRRPATIPLPRLPGVIPGLVPTDCDPPLVMSPAGNCIFPGSPRGAEVFGGNAILGQYGAGMVAGSEIIDRATCLRGMVLGNDGVCYNRSQIRNNQRMWPAGRKPLLTGGDMRAISTAARAGKRMDVATKRLQKMGMMKKPATRRTPRGHVARLEHASDH